jgi:hypothetical protein
MAKMYEHEVECVDYGPNAEIYETSLDYAKLLYSYDSIIYFYSKIAVLSIKEVLFVLKGLFLIFLLDCSTS